MDTPLSSPTPLAPLFYPDYVPHIVQSVLSYLPPSGLAVCMRVSRLLNSLVIPLLYDHVSLSLQNNPFKGLEVYDSENGDRTGVATGSKVACLRQVRILDVHGHHEAVCCRYSPIGWITPSLKILRLFDGKVLSPERASELDRNARPRASRFGHTIRACKLLSDLSPSTLIIFDMFEPGSIPRQPITFGTLPPTFDKAVFVLNSSDRSVWSGEMAFTLLPWSVKHLVFVCQAPQSVNSTAAEDTLFDASGHQAKTPLPLKIDSFTEQVAAIVASDTDRRYTIVNLGTAALRGTENLSEMEASELVRRVLAKRLEDRLLSGGVTRKEADKIIERVGFLALDDYMDGPGRKEFTAAEVEKLRGNEVPSLAA